MKNILVLLFLFSCQTLPPFQDPIPKEEPHYLTPFAKKNGGWKPVYDKYIIDAISDVDALVIAAPDQVKDVCPLFYELDAHDRKVFWSYFIQSMAAAESGLNPLTRYKEGGLGVDAVTKQPVFSEGLLQLSQGDKLNHTACQFDWSKDKLLKSDDPNKTIFDPKIHLTCAVGILNKQIIKRSQLFPEPNFYYWSVLSKKNASGYKRVQEQLVGVPGFCKVESGN